MWILPGGRNKAIAILIKNSKKKFFKKKKVYPSSLSGKDNISESLRNFVFIETDSGFGK
jgi:hypothetical protein